MDYDKEVIEITKKVYKNYLGGQDVDLFFSPSKEKTTEEYRNYLKHALTVINVDIEDDVCNKIEEIIMYENLHSKVVVTESSSLPHIFETTKSTKICLWRGDITTLKIDAIVNAANDQMMGCFRVNHPCIDNAIHTASGPKLRNECRRYMSKSKFAPFPIGKAMITDGYCLPCKKVIHTVGPQLTHDGHEQPDQLAACYTACLDMCISSSLRSIAFCCVSTGIFGYPQESACHVAVEAVKHWLDSGDNSSNMDLIVFNTFTIKDTELYNSIASPIFHSHSKSVPKHISLKELNANEKQKIKEASYLLRKATAIFVAAGAGMSIDAGVNYFDKVTFKNRYPGMRKRGYEYCYQLVGNDEIKKNKSLMWGYYLHNVYHTRFGSEIDFTAYNLVKKMIGDRSSFVFTSNVDGIFERSGFATDKIYTPQGDMQYLQCLNKCTQQSFWKSKETVMDLFDKVDMDTQLLAEKYHPICKRCRGPATFNLRGGDYFLHSPHKEAQMRMNTWLEHEITKEDSHVVILDIGTGFNTPSVIRWPMESLAYSNTNVNLIRINLDHANVDKFPSLESSTRFLGISLPAQFALSEIDTEINKGVNYEDNFLSFIRERKDTDLLFRER